MAKISEPILKIIKYRWPEVVLIIGIGTLAVVSDQLFLSKKIGIEQEHFPPPQQIIFFTIASIISWGFLRTIYIDSLSYRKPLELFKTGLHFLLRMFGLGLLFVAVLVSISAFIYEIANQPELYQNKLVQAAPNEMKLIQLICVLITMLILMKPYLLLPAIIIVMDCKLIESFMVLKKFEFLKAKSLILLFCGQLLLLFIVSIINSQSIPFHVAIVLIAILANFLTLIVSMKAVKLVSTVDSSEAEQNETDKTF